ncbi:hypothetical protein D3Z29_03435 [Rodentibacter pneumotropicus]|nr:hypothetical protein [Rodentibacter pneumotropicus]OOF61624.1 hypothetical protein BH925_01465 [Rodentibacter pneumotropicus]
MVIRQCSLKNKFPKLSFSSKDKNYPKGGMDNYHRQNIGDEDYPKVIIDKKKYPESALHMEEAIANGC